MLQFRQIVSHSGPLHMWKYELRRTIRFARALELACPMTPHEFSLWRSFKHAKILRSTSVEAWNCLESLRSCLPSGSHTAPRGASRCAVNAAYLPPRTLKMVLTSDFGVPVELEACALPSLPPSSWFVSPRFFPVGPPSSPWCFGSRRVRARWWWVLRAASFRPPSLFPLPGSGGCRCPSAAARLLSPRLSPFRPAAASCPSSLSRLGIH